MNHIEYFNASVNQLMIQGPHNSTLAIVQNFKLKGNYPDFYQALDSLGFKIGIEYLVQQVWDDASGEVKSYVPALKLHDGNPLTGKFEVIEFAEFKSAAKAYAYVAKEQVYKLMSIPDLEQLV